MGNKSELHANFSTPTASGYFEAFGSIMFAFGGASTFPTIQVSNGPSIHYQQGPHREFDLMGSKHFWEIENYLILEPFSVKI